MVTVKDRLNAIRSNTRYLGDEVDATIINNGILVTITFYVKAYNVSCSERMEKWVVPNANIDNYLTQTAYKISYTVVPKAYSVQVFGRFRRWFR